MRKKIALLLCMAMVLSLAAIALPTGVLAAKVGDTIQVTDPVNGTVEVYTVKKLPDQQNPGEVEYTSCTTGQGVVNIQVSQSIILEGTTYEITSIGEGAFTNCADLTVVRIIPDVAFPSKMFDDCPILTMIFAPPPKSIAADAFSGTTDTRRL